MPIGLDVPIYAIPCGEPGDVGALSGRAHACDWMRLMVTLCRMCNHCLPGTDSPELRVEVSEAMLGACCRSYWRSELVVGAVNGLHVLARFSPQELCAWWNPEIATIRCLGYAYSNCQGSVVATELRTVGMIFAIRSLANWFPWPYNEYDLVFGMWETIVDGGQSEWWFLDGLNVAVPLNCSGEFLFQNELTCDLQGTISGGRAILNPEQ